MRTAAIHAVVVAATSALALPPGTRAQSDFQRPIHDTGAAQPTAFAFGDIDGDGRPDAAVVHEATDKLGLVFAEPGGGFSAPTVFNTGDKPRDVAIADFDLDGRADVVTFNENAGTLTLVLRKATGPVVSTWPAGGKGFFLAVGDLDSDGDPDVVAGSWTPKSLFVLLGQGAAGLAAPVAYPAPGLVGPLALEDFNGDGALDVAFAHGSTTGLTLRLGDGSGGLQAGTTLATVAGGLAAADLDQDGDLDLATASGTNLVLIRNGPGGFGSPELVPAGVAISVVDAADLDHDGLMDVLVDAKPVPGGLSFLSRMPGLGGGAFAAPIEMVHLSLFNVAVDDVDDDLRPDVVSLVNGLVVLRGDGEGGLFESPAVTIPQQAFLYAMGDLNGDGFDDLVSSELGDVGGPVSVQLGDGQGQWTAPQLQSVQAASFLELADVTGDGELDLLTAATNGFANYAYLISAGDGAGGFAAPTQLVPPGLYPVGLAAADLDLDGDQDLAAVVFQEALFGTQYRCLMAFQNDGSGRFTTFGSVRFYNSVGSNTPADPVVVGDCNGDGFPDAVVLDQSIDELDFFAGGAAGFEDVEYGAFVGPSFGQRILTLSDLDDDGALDLLVACNPVQIRPGLGDGTFGAAQNIGAVQGDDLQLADLDGDGVDEIVMDSSAGSIPDHAVFVWHADGAGGYQLERYFSERVTRSFAIDANQDGRLDLLAVPSLSQFAVNPLGDGHVLYNHTLLAAWTDFGHGLAGSFGVPSLIGQGTLKAGSPGALKLTGANPNKLAVLFIGATANPTPFKGGMLVPIPPTIMFTFFTSPIGTINVGWSSWKHMPPGTDWFFQYGIVDSAAPAGASLSNAVRLLQP